MPIPTVDESKNNFLNRCIPVLINEGKDRDTSITICNNQYQNKSVLDFIEWVNNTTF